MDIGEVVSQPLATHLPVSDPRLREYCASAKLLRPFGSSLTDVMPEKLQNPCGTSIRNFESLPGRGIIERRPHEKRLLERRRNLAERLFVGDYTQI